MHPIFEYTDYRLYLAAYYEYKKTSFPYFSYRFFSQKIGINSPSFLKHVIDGKRNLTTKMAERFSKALDLSVKEDRYFRNLILFNQAKTAGEKQEYVALLRTMTGTVKETVLDADQDDYFSAWYIPVLRELICLCDFKDDYEKVAAFVNPPILSSEAMHAVELLLRLKLVERRDDGTYRQAAAAVTADSTITSPAVRSFIYTMFDRAKASVDAVGKAERHVSGLTMAVSPEAYGTIIAEIEAFRSRLKTIVQGDSGCNRIYQLTLGMFPVSEALPVLPGKTEDGQ